ncbi:protein SON isoform X2 [Cuculus canorus]|uniref:protein SON isoform X2 n=1 Tax=Cuculus canorus TaxID=55661 RepID=UPI0023AA7F3B|nr:protein SON isoform X2 [Cuculus canorus]
MAANIEQIFRSFVVSKMREIQEEQEQQQHGGGKVEGQPNGDTIPAEQANPSDDTVAGAGSRQNDQIVQKIEEVLSGALDTELQCKSDVDKKPAKSSSKSAKRSSTGEDEIPRKKSKKNKKHKSKKKKKKKKKRKKEKKHKKQPKEAKLSTRHGEHAELQPASHLMPEKSSSQLSEQHGGSGDANLAVHMQSEQVCLKASEELDRQALGLVSHSGTDSQQSLENLGSEKGTLCQINPPFNLQGGQSDIQENTSITQTNVCTREEQIKQSHENIYPTAINASEIGVRVDTGNDTLSSIPSAVVSRSEIQKASSSTLASEVIEALEGSEVILKSKGTGKVKALDTALESDAMEVLNYSEVSLQSVAQWGAKELGATSESVSLASNVTAIAKSANQAEMNTVKVAHLSVAMEEGKIPEAEKSLHMGNVKNVERSLELGDMSRTLEPVLKPSLISDNLGVMQCSPMDSSGVSPQHAFKISAVTAVNQAEIKSAKVPLGLGAVTKVKDIEQQMQNVKALEEALQPVAVVEPKTLETIVEPVGVTAKDVKAAQECLQTDVVKDMESTTDPATVLNASGMFLRPKVLTETKSMERTQESALPAELADRKVVVEARSLTAIVEPAVAAQTCVPQTTPEIQVTECFKGPQATVEVAALAGIKSRETSQATLQLENTSASKISESILQPISVPEAKGSEAMWFLRQEKLRESGSETEANVRGLEATPLSLQKDVARGLAATLDSTAVSKGSEVNAHLLAMKVGSLRPVKSLETTTRRVSETEIKDSEADRAGTEMKMCSSHLYMKGVGDLGHPASVGLAKTQGLEAVLQPGTLSVGRGLAENVSSEAKMDGKVIEASQGLNALEERTERTPESVVTCVSMEPVKESEALAGMMHLKTTAGREPKHTETAAEPLGASRTVCSIISQSQVMTHTRTSQTGMIGEMKDSEQATRSGTVEVRGLDNLSEVEAIAEVKTLQLKQMKNLEMVVGSETRTLMQGLGGTLAPEVVTEMRHSEVAPEDSNKAEARSGEAVEPVQTVMSQTLETSSKPEAVLESLSRAEEKTVASEILTEARKGTLESDLESEISTDVTTQGPAVEYITETRRTSTKTDEPLLINLKGLEETSETEKAMETEYLEPSSEAGEVRWLQSMKESATVKKDSETTEEPEVHMDIRGLETSQTSGNVAMDVLDDASGAVQEYLHTEKQEHLEGKPAAESRRAESAPEILSAVEMKSSEAVPKPGDMKDLETTLEHEVAAEVQYAEGMQGQQMEDVRVQAEECEMMLDKGDGEQTEAFEPLIEETVLSSSHAAGKKDSAGTYESEIDTKQLEAAPAGMAGAKDLEAGALPETVVELQHAEAAVRLEAETKDLEAAAVPETVTEAAAATAEESQSEGVLQAEAVKEATPEQESRRRDSETSDVQPDVAARMKETLMRLEKVIEKSSHRSSDKKHDAKKQKRSRSKSQSRSRKRKKKSRSRSTSRRLTSKRARSRSRNDSVSRKKHSKSRSRSVEKRERRVSSRRSRRRRSRSSDRYRSKSRSPEKRLSSGRSRHRRSRSSDRYRSKSGSVEKRQSSRRSRRRRSRSSDRYRSKSRSMEKRQSSRRSGRRRSRSSDRYRSKSRSVEKRQSSRRSGRRRSRSSDRYRSKSRSVEKRQSSRRSGRRRSRSSDRYRSKSRSVEKRLSSRRSGRRRSRSSDRYRSKSLSVEKRESRLSSRRSRRRRSRSSDRSKSRSRSSEKRGGKEYSWRFRNRSGSSDRSKSRSRSVEKRSRKASLRRSKRQRSKSSDGYKSRSRSVEKRERKQSSRKSKRKRSKSSDRYKSRSKSVEKKKESSRKSKRRRSKSSDRYKSRSRSAEKKHKESSKKSKRKRSKSSDSVKSRSKSTEKRGSKLSSLKSSSKCVESSGPQESTKSLEKVDVPEASEGSSSKSSNGPMSVALSAEGINGPALPPTFGSLDRSSSSVENAAELQPSAMPELGSSETQDSQELRSMPVEAMVSELSVTSENGSAEKSMALESPLPELTYSTCRSRSSSVEKTGDPGTSSVTEFQLSTSCEDESISLEKIEGPELLLTLESGCSVSSGDYKTISSSSGKTEVQGSSLMSDGHELSHISIEKTPIKFLQVPESGSSTLADSPESRSLSPETVEAQKSFLAPEVTSSAFPDVCESASLPIEKSQMQEPSPASDNGCFKSPDGHESGSGSAARIEKLPLMSEGGSYKSPDGNQHRSSSVENVKVADISLASECGPVENLRGLISASYSEKMQEVVLTTVEQSCKSSEVHGSGLSVDRVVDGPALSQVVDSSESSEMRELRYLPSGRMEGTGSFLIKSGIPVCHDGHKSKHNYIEKTEGVELSLAPELRCSAFPEGCELTSTGLEKMEVQKPSLPLEDGFSTSADCELGSTATEKLQAQVTSLTSEGGLFLLPDSHEMRPIPAEKVEVQKSRELKYIASPDGHELRSAYDEEIQVQEPPVILESRCFVSSDGHALTPTRVEVEEPSQISENDYTVGLDGPELAPAEKTEMRELHQMSEERYSVSVESQELQSHLVEKADVQEPALTPENEYAVSWENQELRTSSPEKTEMHKASVALFSEDHKLPSSLSEKTEVQECSVLSENEYAVSPEGHELAVSPAARDGQEPILTSDGEYTVFPEGQGLLAENTVVQEPSLVPHSQYAASPEGQELLYGHTEKAEVQECSLPSENEYEVSPESHDLKSSLVEKEEMEEPSETSESESSVSADSQEQQSSVVRRADVQELSLSEGECAMSPEGQELQSSPAENVEAKEPSLTSENEHALSPEGYESRFTHAEKTQGVDSSLISESDHHLSFESQEVKFTTVEKADVQERSPTPENEHGGFRNDQELGYTTAGNEGCLEPLTSNDRASMSPDGSDLKSMPVENMDDAVPSLLPESGFSMSPGGYSVKSGLCEETGDLEPSSIAERRHSVSSYQEDHELQSPVEEEGLESSLTPEHRRSVSPEGHDQKSTVDEELDDREPSLTSEHRQSLSPDDRESRSSIGEEAEYLEQPLTTERRSSVSSDEHESRSTTGEEVEDAEPSLTAERRDSTSSDDRESRSTTGEDVEDGEASLTAERRHSTSSDDHESRSTTGEEGEDMEPSLTAEDRRSVSPDGQESRSTLGEEAEDQELALADERTHSTSSDEHESRSTAGEDVEDMEPSLTAEGRDSTSSDEHESRSTAGEEGEDVEPSLTTEHRRSISPDGRESRSTTGEEVDDVEPSLTAERRDSTSSEEHESRSTTGEEGEDAEASLADEDKQDSMPLDRSEEQDSSFIPESRRSESSEREKSVDKMSDKESSQRSTSRHSKSPSPPKSRSTSVEKVADESSRRSRHRRSRSTARQKSRSTSAEKTVDKESSRRSRRRRSRSTARQRSQSTSVEKAADKESSRRSRRRRSRSTARQRSRSKSVEKTADKESSRRSRSRRSRSSQRRSQRYDTESRSRRNRSRSGTRRRASRSKSNRRSRSSSLSRSRHRRRSRSRSASRRRRSLSRDRRKRSQRNRSRSTDRRRRRSDSRDRRISLRLRSRSRTPVRQRRSRSRGRRRSSSRSPIRLRRSRSSGRRRYSRSPDRRRSRSSERFSSRSPKRLTDLDKAQLLEIAKANAAAMCAKSGVPLPPSLMPLLSQKKDDKANQKSSRDTLKELTEKCKKIAQSTDDVIVNKPHVSDEEEEERPFYNHPFKLSEPKPIFFNLSTPSIKPAPPPQPKNQVSLSKEFPVSSGSQHRKKEADSVYGEWVPVEKGKEESKDDVFPKPSIEGVDITAAMNDRATAQKRLSENSFDLEAMCMLNRAQEQIDAWAQSNSIPGQFTGSTGAQILSSDELTNSGPQAWIRKDQFLRAAPVTGGMGAQLMRKMGWREGEGLGKNKEGSVEPIMVDFKTDRKGLVAVGEKAQKRSGHYVVMKDLSGKHPVSALMEICNKRRWTPPEFVLVDDSGPDHRKHFIFKVRVNGNEYRPTFASLNKKHAKATAATAALQAMGLVPKESMVNTTMFRSASHR